MGREREELGEKMKEIDHIVAKPNQHVLKAWNSSNPKPTSRKSPSKRRQAVKHEESSEDEFAADDALHRAASQKAYIGKENTLRNTPVKSLSLLQQNNHVIDTLDQVI
jgi:hypothetical protein